MAKWLVLALAAFILYKLLTNDKAKKNKEEVKARESKIASGQMVKDPICGVYVDVDGSISVRDNDKIYRFCSYECRQAFLDGLERGGREISSASPEDDAKQ